MAVLHVPSSANAYRRQKQIEDCLYNNLLQRPYSSVSVSDLCCQLDLSRKSFYYYFPDKDSCFRSIVNRLLRRCVLLITTGMPEDSTQEDKIAAFLSYWKNERNFLDMILRNNLLFLVMDQCNLFLTHEEKFIQKYLNTPNLQDDPFVMRCYVNMQITIILQWHMHGYGESLEEMVLKYRRLFYQPLLNLDKKEQ